MSSTLAQSNLTAGFIDLATYDELEKYMYGGADATAYFVREVVKATWFTMAPAVLTISSGCPQFCSQWSANITRAGDYLMYCWLRLTLPEVNLSETNQFSPAPAALRWTRNLMHNLIVEANITFNDLVAMRFDNYFLDFWSAFVVPAGKRNGYNNMIGNLVELTNPLLNDPFSTQLPETVLNLPLPFFFARDSGVALPTAALPYNDMRLNFTFRDWKQLLIIDRLPYVNGAGALVPPVSVPATDADVVTAPVLKNVQTWSNYSIVSNDERKRMGRAPRDILIEQVQTAPCQTCSPSSNPCPNFDIRFSHAVKGVFFGVQNTTNGAEWSNYTTASPVPTPFGIIFTPSLAWDPISVASLFYESTLRLGNMGSDYYSLINPFYHAPVIPVETGYHMYSYTIDLIAIDPAGSTNYGKLTNVTISYTYSSAASTTSAATGTIAAPGDLAFDGAPIAQTFRNITVIVNNNVIRVSGGD
jgi:hypothetical protein